MLIGNGKCNTITAGREKSCGTSDIRRRNLGCRRNKFVNKDKSYNYKGQFKFKSSNVE